MYTRSTTHSGADSWAPWVNGSHLVSEAEQSASLTGGELTDSEVSSGIVGTDMLSITMHLDWRGRTAKGLTGASSTAAMVV